jgi:competence protein ComEA
MLKWRRAHPVAWLVILFLLSHSPSAADSALPEGDGKDAVEDTCRDCHTLRRIEIQRLDEQGWKSILREMLESGATVNPEDANTIIKYLAKNFGPDRKININKAQADEISAALRLTDAEAKAVIRYRKGNGAFKDLATLEQASGAPEKIEAKKSLIEF